MLAVEVDDDATFARVDAGFMVRPRVVRVVDGDRAGLDRMGGSRAEGRQESLEGSGESARRGQVDHYETVF